MKKIYSFIVILLFFGACSSNGVPNNVYFTRIIINLETHIDVSNYTVTNRYVSSRLFDIKRNKLESDELCSFNTISIPSYWIPNRTVKAFVLGWLVDTSKSAFLVVLSKNENLLYLAQVIDNKIGRLILISAYAHYSSTNYYHLFTKRNKNCFTVYARSMCIEDDAVVLDNLDYTGIKPHFFIRLIYSIKDGFYELFNKKYDVVLVFHADTEFYHSEY